MITQLKIAITDDCNKYISNNFIPISSISEIEELIKISKYKTLVITGDEPLLKFNIVQLLLRLPIPIKILQTNGLLLNSFKIEQLYYGQLTGLNINIEDTIPFILGDRQILQELNEKFDLRIFIHKTDDEAGKILLYFAENSVLARIIEAKPKKSVEEDRYVLRIK